MTHSHRKHRQGALSAEALPLLAAVALAGAAAFGALGHAGANAIAAVSGGDGAAAARATTPRPAPGPAGQAGSADHATDTFEGVGSFRGGAAAPPSAAGTFAKRAMLAFPLTGPVLYGPAAFAEFWRGVGSGVVHWFREVGSGLGDLLAFIAQKPKNDWPAPFNYPRAWAEGLWHVVTHPFDALNVIFHAAGSFSDHLVQLGQGCALRAASARDAGLRCGELAAEVGSFYVGGELLHRLMHSRFAGPLRHMGSFESHNAVIQAEKLTAKVARAEKRAARRGRWLGRADEGAGGARGAAQAHVDDLHGHAHHTHAHHTHAHELHAHADDLRHADHAHHGHHHHALTPRDEAIEWLREKTIVLLPHLLIDDGPRVIMRGHRREEQGIVGGTAAHSEHD